MIVQELSSLGGGLRLPSALVHILDLISTPGLVYLWFSFYQSLSGSPVGLNNFPYTPVTLQTVQFAVTDVGSNASVLQATV